MIDKRLPRSLLLGLAALLLLSSCGLFGYVALPDEVVLWGDSFTISWDPPAIYSGMPAVEDYVLYYRSFRAVAMATNA